MEENLGIIDMDCKQNDKLFKLCIYFRNENKERDIIFLRVMYNLFKYNYYMFYGNMVIV